MMPTALTRILYAAAVVVAAAPLGAQSQPASAPVPPAPRAVQAPPLQRPPAPAATRIAAPASNRVNAPATVGASAPGAVPAAPVGGDPVPAVVAAPAAATGTVDRPAPLAPPAVLPPSALMSARAIPLTNAPGAPPAGSTGRCKDGTYLTGAASDAQCSAHGGLAILFAAPVRPPAAPARRQ